MVRKTVFPNTQTTIQGTLKARKVENILRELKQKYAYITCSC
jgi:septum formation inhibitor-activating ATPase MinD